MKICGFSIAIGDLIQVSGVTVALLAIVYDHIKSRKERMANRKMRVLEYVSSQLDTRDIRMARNYLNKNYNSIISGDISLYDNLKKAENEEIKNSIKVYLAGLDKVGTGLMVGALDLDVFFHIWQPPWVAHQWKCLRLYIKGIEEESGIYQYYKGIEFIVKKAHEIYNDEEEEFVLRVDSKINVPSTTIRKEIDKEAN